MTSAPLGDEHEAERLDALIAEWHGQWCAGGLFGEVEHRAEADDRGHFHWLIRLHGEEKDVITIWLRLRQRTVYVETEVMAAPEENREALFGYLLAKNAMLQMVHAAIGAENGIYLVASIPTGDLTIERLDELVGAAVTYVDEIFPTAMSMGLPLLYRRRRLP